MRHSTTRREFLRTASLLAVVPSILPERHFRAQQIHHIGYFNGDIPALTNGFIAELEGLGFKEGENVRIEKRLQQPNSDGSAMAAELAKMDLSLVVAGALPFALQIRKNNPDMPMVIGTCPGMVSNRFAASLERPAGIYTGMDELPPGLTTKRLQLLKSAAPEVSRIALLSTTPGTGGHEIQLEEARKSAPTIGIEVKSYRAASLEQLKAALNDIVADGMDGMLNFQGGLSLANRKFIVDFAASNKLPAIYQATMFAEAGGLMTWAPNLEQQFKEVAHYVAKILKGAKPGDLAVKHPEKYYLTLNASTARALGIHFSKELLAEASKVIE